MKFPIYVSGFIAFVMLAAGSVMAASDEIIDPGELLPGDNRIENFRMDPPDWHRFGDTGLYSYINGAAELFFEYGFDRGCSAEYTGDGKRLTVELFKMTSADAAYGIYTLSNYFSKIEQQAEARFKVNESGDSVAKNLKGDYYNLIQDVAVEFFKGDIYGIITIDTEDRFSLMAFTNMIMAKIPKHASRPKVMSLLPAIDKIPGSERYAKGIIGMSRILDLGRGDIFGLKSGTEIVGAEYRISSGSYYSMLVINYRNEKIAEDKYKGLRDMFNHWEGYKPTVFHPADNQTNVFLVSTPQKDYMGFRWLGERIEIFYNVKTPGNFKMILEKDQNISVRFPSQ